MKRIFQFSTFLVVLFSVISAGYTQTTQATLKLQEEIYDKNQIEFSDFYENGGSIALKLPNAPVESLRVQVEQLYQLPMPLNHLDPARIEIVSHAEYTVLREKLTMEEMLAIVKGIRKEFVNYEVQCFGAGTVVDGTEVKSTFYLVTDRVSLKAVRDEIELAFVNAGGDETLFDAGEFLPYISIGYTHDELSEVDGVVKNPASCDPNVDIEIVQKQ
jgi:hypothetical protein